jgi:cytochrome o ubiquinol oxidase subunit 2
MTTMRLNSWVAPALLFFPLAGCGGVLDPHGPVGVSEKLILTDSLAIMLAIVVPLILATIGFAWWFRASNKRATYLPNWDFSGHLELIVWAIPTLVIIFLGGIAWFGSHALDPYKALASKAKPVEVEVVSLDWKWLFIYQNEGIATVNQLVVPVGTPLHFRLTSSGVMNSFFVPQLGSQIYTMPGMTTRLNLLAERPGDYPGLSSNFSGDGFSDMRFLVHAVPASEFSGWVARTRSEGTALDTAAYVELARPGGDVKPQTYRGVEPNLFERIVQQNTAKLAASPSGER